MKEPFVSFRFDVFLSMNLEAQNYPKETYFQEHVLSLGMFKGDFLHSTMVKQRWTTVLGEYFVFCSKHLLQIQVISEELPTAGGDILWEESP